MQLTVDDALGIAARASAAAIQQIRNDHAAEVARLREQLATVTAERDALKAK